MIACWPVKKTSRALIWTISLLLLAMLITGCDLDGYPDDLRYPSRMDPLAIEKPKEDASDYDRPGEFPNVLFAGLPEKQRRDILRDPSELTPTGELIFTDVLWPDFRRGDLFDAIREFQRRERRFGGVEA